MKLLFSVLIAVVVVETPTVVAFAPTPLQCVPTATLTRRWANNPDRNKESKINKNKNKKTTNLWDDWVQDMFQRPLHGHGTGANKLGTIYKEELAVLEDRKKHYRKDQLHDKYAAKNKNNQNKSWLDDILSHPFHGRGSGQDKMDKMYQAQQQVLYERREYYGNKAQLRKKYSQHVDHLKDIPVHPDDPAMLNQKED